MYIVQSETTELREQMIIDLVLNLDEYLETEKQQIVDAFTAGQIDIANTFLKEYKERGFDNELDELAILNNDKEDGNEYFNNTFK